jgi:hypothetical protein
LCSISRLSRRCIAATSERKSRSPKKQHHLVNVLEQCNCIDSELEAASRRQVTGCIPEVASASGHPRHGVERSRAQRECIFAGRSCRCRAQRLRDGGAAGGYDPKDFGEPLMKNAFDPDNGPMGDRDAKKPMKERAALQTTLYRRNERVPKSGLSSHAVT